MSERTWEVVDEVAGELQAEMLRGLLEAQGIQVLLSQEGLSHSYALTVGRVGLVQILVPSDQAQSARSVLGDYYAGRLENTRFVDGENPPGDEISGTKPPHSQP